MEEVKFEPVRAVVTALAAGIYPEKESKEVLFTIANQSEVTLLEPLSKNKRVKIDFGIGEGYINKNNIEVV